MVRESNTEVINFYNAIGYKKDAVITMGKRLIPDD
jgi:ribosomal protein S18 acetylase RimI-like enzyme